MRTLGGSSGFICRVGGTARMTYDSYVEKSADDEKGPMPSTRALNSMRAQLTRAQLTPAQLLAAILLSLAIPLMLLPTCPYRPCTPPPPTMPRSANSQPQVSQPNHPARNTLHPRATHTKHTSPLPALLDGTGLLQMSSKGTSHKVAPDRITTKHSHTRDTRNVSSEVMGLQPLVLTVHTEHP